MSDDEIYAYSVDPKSLIDGVIVPAGTATEQARQRQEMLNAIVGEGGNARRLDVGVDSCPPYADPDMAASWQMGWRRMDEHLRRRAQARSAPRVSRLEDVVMRALPQVPSSEFAMVVDRDESTGASVSRVRISPQGARLVAHAIVRWLGGFEASGGAPAPDPDKFHGPGISQS